MRISAFSLFHKKILTKMFQNLSKTKYCEISNRRCLKGTVPRDFQLHLFSLTFSLSWTLLANLPRCRWYRWCTSTCEYLRDFSNKFEMTLTIFFTHLGEADHEKNLKQKISWHCPLSEKKHPDSQDILPKAGAGDLTAQVTCWGDLTVRFLRRRPVDPEKMDNLANKTQNN